MIGRLMTAVVVAGVIAVGMGTAFCGDASAVGKIVSEPSVTKSSTVSIKAESMKVKEILESFAKQTKEQIVVESSVTGQVSLTLTAVPLETALNALSKTSGKIEWRAVYLAADSDLIKQPDKLSSTIRLMTGLSFPNLIVASSSKDRLAAHFEDKKGVASAEESAVKALGLTKVYLITNDAAVAAKAKEQDKKETKEAVDKFVKSQKDQMDAFMKMTPEEREEAIMASLNMMDQVDANYVGAAMDALAKADPEALRRNMMRQSEMLLNMSQESRRAMIRMNMKAQQMIAPEIQQLLAEDVKAVMEEMKAQQGDQ